LPEDTRHGATNSKKPSKFGSPSVQARIFFSSYRLDGNQRSEHSDRQQPSAIGMGGRQNCQLTAEG
jgi:hypothetical protein